MTPRSYDYTKWLEQDLADCDSILELGCGENSPLLKIGLGSKTYAMDIWSPYVEAHKQRHDYCECWEGNILTATFARQGWDAIVMCDVLEHLPKKNVEETRLLRKLDRAARKRVIIFCPNGERDNPSPDGNPFQSHISVWSAAEFVLLGYQVRGSTGIRWFLGPGAVPKWPRGLMNILAGYSQILVYDHPEFAYHSYAVKEL